MHPKIQNLSVQIVRFVDNRQPGWVECEFVDAEGRKHRIVDKVLMFTAEPLDDASTYPRPGLMACEVLDEWRETDGRAASISTARPVDIESTEGVSEFVVLSTQLSD